MRGIIVDKSMEITTNIPITEREEYIKGFQDGFNAGTLKALVKISNTLEKVSLDILNNKEATDE